MGYCCRIQKSPEKLKTNWQTAGDFIELFLSKMNSATVSGHF